MASRRIEDLYEHFQPLIRQLLDEANKKTSPWTTFITDGFRSYEEQNELYAQGRTKPGRIITNAKAGYSWHNHGLAVDIAFQKDGILSYSQNLYDKIVPIAKSLGLSWGGDWAIFIDKPHFEWHPGITLADARDGKRPSPTTPPDDIIEPPDMNDQTKIPLGGKWGTLEIQQIRSKLNDSKRDIENLTNSIAVLSKTNKELGENIKLLEKELTKAEGRVSSLERSREEIEEYVKKLGGEGETLKDKIKHISLMNTPKPTNSLSQLFYNLFLVLEK